MLSVTFERGEHVVSTGEYPVQAFRDGTHGCVVGEALILACTMYKDSAGKYQVLLSCSPHTVSEISFCNITMKPAGKERKACCSPHHQGQERRGDLQGTGCSAARSGELRHTRRAAGGHLPPAAEQLRRCPSSRGHLHHAAGRGQPRCLVYRILNAVLLFGVFISFTFFIYLIFAFTEL